MFALKDPETVKLSLSIWFLEITSFKEVSDYWLVSIFCKMFVKMSRKKVSLL